jgi:hypothetical protein
VVLDGEVLFKPLDPTGSNAYGLKAVDTRTGRVKPSVPHVYTTLGGIDSSPSVTAEGLLLTEWQVMPGTGGYGWVLVDLPSREIKGSLYTDEYLSGNKRNRKVRGTGARGETKVSSVFGDVFVVHHFNGFSGNPSTQTGAYHRGERTWYVGRDTPNPPYRGRIPYRNTQQAACAVSGANGLLYRQFLHTVICDEPRRR